MKYGLLDVGFLVLAVIIGFGGSFTTFRILGSEIAFNSPVGSITAAACLGFLHSRNKVLAVAAGAGCGFLGFLFWRLYHPSFLELVEFVLAQVSTG